MTRLFDPNPRFLELRVMPQGGGGPPEFIWGTFPVARIAAVTPMREADGCIVTFSDGNALACSNSYADVSDALVSDAKRFGFDLDEEARLLARVTVEDEDDGEDVDTNEDALDFLEELPDLGDFDDALDAFENDGGDQEENL